MVNVSIIKCWTGGSGVIQDSINKAWLHNSRSRTLDHTHTSSAAEQQETKRRIPTTYIYIYRNSSLLQVSALQLSLSVLFVLT